MGDSGTAWLTEEWLLGNLEEVKTFGDKADFSVILCEKGVIYTSISAWPSWRVYYE